MANNYIEQTDQERLEREQRKHRGLTVLLIVLLITALVCVALYIIDRYRHKVYDSYEVVKQVERTDSVAAVYIPYNGNSILKYSRDGALAIDSEGNILWNGSYDFNSPAADTCGNYAVIADIGGTKAVVFNGTDSGTEIEVLLPIVEARVAGQGVVALLLEDSTSNVLNIYNPYASDKELLVEIPTSVQEDGFPIDFAISEDGTKVVTSFLNIKNGVQENYLNFYNFDEVGKNTVNRLVGARNMEDQMVAKVEFLNNNTVCAFTENGFLLYDMKQIPSDLFTKEFKDNIKGVCYDKEHIAVALGSLEEAGNTGIRIYDMEGNEVLNRKTGFQFDSMYLSDGELVLYGNISWNVLRLDGTMKYEGDFESGIEKIFPVDNYETYIVMDSSKINIIHMGGAGFDF